jgi:hypothetical protein
MPFGAIINRTLHSYPSLSSIHISVHTANAKTIPKVLSVQHIVLVRNIFKLPSNQMSSLSMQNALNPLENGKMVMRQRRN